MQTLSTVIVLSDLRIQSLVGRGAEKFSEIKDLEILLNYISDTFPYVSHDLWPVQGP